MRIVGGKARGLALATPKSNRIRPTTDRTRESLFNILAHRPGFDLNRARVIDLFAGTGALGFEALSRGAEFALFVDDGVEAQSLIRRNMEAMRMNRQAKIFRRDATKLGPRTGMAPFTLAFLDPPYERGLGERALSSLDAGQWLAAEALVVFEEAEKAVIALPANFDLVDERRYGASIVRFLQYASVKKIKTGEALP